jgi:hypothetical protein
MPEGASGGKLLNLRSGCEFDCFGLCGFGFAGCRGAGGLRNLYGDVWGFPDACSATGGGKWVQARGGAGAGGEELDFLQVFGQVFIGARRQAAPLFVRIKLFARTQLLLRVRLLLLLLLLAQALQLLVDLLRSFDSVGGVWLG